MPPSGNLCTPLHIIAGSQHCHVAAWGYAFECLQCPRAIIWQPILTCLHACNVPILTCGSQVAPICSPFISKGQHVICLFAHLLHPKAVTWDCFGIRSCLNTCCLSESANGSQAVLFSGSLCARDKTWQPEHQFKISTLSQHHYMVTCLHACHVPRSPYGSLSMLVHMPPY